MENVVALVAKPILKPKNGVVTPFKSATNLRQGQHDCRKKTWYAVGKPKKKQGFFMFISKNEYSAVNKKTKMRCRRFFATVYETLDK